VRRSDVPFFSVTRLSSKTAVYASSQPTIPIHSITSAAVCVAAHPTPTKGDIV